MKHQETFEEYCKTLVPPRGPCDTVAGEMVRAAKILYKDLHDHGVGINNTSDAMNYLLRKNVIRMDDVRELYLCSRQYVRGDRDEVSKRMQPVVDIIIDAVCEQIIEHPTWLTQKNTEDLWDYMEDEIMICDVCECTSLTDDSIEERTFYDPSEVTLLCHECYMNLDFDDKYQ